MGGRNHFSHSKASNGAGFCWFEKLPTNAERTVVRVGNVRVPVEVELGLTLPHFEVCAVHAVIAVHLYVSIADPHPCHYSFRL